MDKEKKLFQEILKNISILARKFKIETDQDFQSIDVAVFIEDLESEVKKLKILYEQIE